jgi:hypothetical protein
LKIVRERRFALFNDISLTYQKKKIVRERC